MAGTRCREEPAGSGLVAASGDGTASACTLTGQGAVQFGGVDAGSGQTHAVTANGFRSAALDKFRSDVPLVGE